MVRAVGGPQGDYSQYILKTKDLLKYSWNEIENLAKDLRSHGTTYPGHDVLEGFHARGVYIQSLINNALDDPALGSHSLHLTEEESPSRQPYSGTVKEYFSEFIEPMFHQAQLDLVTPANHSSVTISGIGHEFLGIIKFFHSPVFNQVYDGPPAGSRRQFEEPILHLERFLLSSIGQFNQLVQEVMNLDDFAPASKFYKAKSDCQMLIDSLKDFLAFPKADLTWPYWAGIVHIPGVDTTKDLINHVLKTLEPIPNQIDALRSSGDKMHGNLVIRGYLRSCQGLIQEVIDHPQSYSIFS